MNIFYDGLEEKDETKQYKLVRKVSENGTLFLYYESYNKSEIEIEIENLKKENIELKSIVADLSLTILDLIPMEEIPDKEVIEDVPDVP